MVEFSTSRAPQGRADASLFLAPVMGANPLNAAPAEREERGRQQHIFRVLSSPSPACRGCLCGIKNIAEAAISMG